MAHDPNHRKPDAALGLVNRTSHVTPSLPGKRSNRHLRHLEERALLTGGVCAEVQASDGDYTSMRVRNGITVFQQWIADQFGVPESDRIRFDHGLEEFDPDTHVNGLIREIRAGARVCYAVQLFWWADSPMESARDAECIVDDLATYLAARSDPDHE